MFCIAVSMCPVNMHCRITFLSRFDEFVDSCIVPISVIRVVEKDIAKTVFEDDTKYKDCAYLDNMINYLYNTGYVSLTFMSTVKDFVKSFEIRIYQ